MVQVAPEAPEAQLPVPAEPLVPASQEPELTVLAPPALARLPVALPALAVAAPGGVLNDAAIVEVPGSRLAFTTDSYVVSPIRFPGGDIGSANRAGLFPGGDGTAIERVDGTVEPGDVVAVTIEAAGGVDAPTTAPIAASGPV